MKTNFTLALNNINIRSGSIPEDKKLVEQFVAEIVALADSFSKKIEDFDQLRQVMTNSDELSLKDTVTALRHLQAELKSLCDLFRLTELIGPIDVARAKVETQLSDAEKSVKRLLGLVYR